MPHDAARHADEIESRVSALAARTVERHIQQDAAFAANIDPTRADWEAHTRTRLLQLAQSVAVERPALFAETMRWTQEGFLAHGASTADLIASLDHMRAAIDDDLSARAAAATTPHIEAALTALSEPVQPRPPMAPGPLSKPRLRYLEAVLSGDQASAIEQIRRVAESGATPQEIYAGLLQVAQHEMGQMWLRDEISIADEHFATATTERALAELRRWFQTSPPNGKRVALAGVSGDFHGLGLRMIADLFELDGWDVAYLGPNMPIDDLIEFLNRRPPDLLGLSGSTCLHVRVTALTIAAVRRHWGAERLPILVGGRPFDQVEDLWLQVGADACAHGLTETVHISRQLVGLDPA